MDLSPLLLAFSEALYSLLPLLLPPLWNRAAGFIPVCSLGLAQVGRMNLGKDASTFKYYTMCGLQEGFEPFAVNMNREVTMWFSKRLPTFVNVPKDHNHIAVSKRSDRTRSDWFGSTCLSSVGDQD